jgi:predicted ATPase
MRLRFLHLQNYLPFHDIAINFSAESPLERECAIRFVVGINGTGKTHLLQALTTTFTALSHQKVPHFPVTIIYELGQGKERRTVIFDHQGKALSAGWWQSKSNFPPEYRKVNWLQLVEDVRKEKEDWDSLIAEGNWPGKGVGLPRAVIAYTTGDPESWIEIFRTEPPAQGVDIHSQSLNYDAEMERPAGWNRRTEIDYRSKLGTEDSTESVKNLRKLEEESRERKIEEGTCIFLEPILLKFILLAVTLPLAMEELRRYEREEDTRRFIDQVREKPDGGAGLRRLLAQIGWVWPVSVSFTVDFRPQEWSKDSVSRMISFFAAPTAIIRETEPSTKRKVIFDLKERKGEEYCGDALLNFLGGESTTSFDVFRLLLSLYQQKLVEDVQMAVRVTAPEEILLFDELSDGEQMYLERMALFHLMKGQQDALILLDEPETHFNDKWKREIVDIIDDALRYTANDVLISTHSSIALTDVFNDEIVLFEKQDGDTRRIEAIPPTFGADPSEIMINIFKVRDSIGKRALEWLDTQLKRDWKPEERGELEKMIRTIGPGLHRAELRSIWRKLNASQN